MAWHQPLISIVALMQIACVVLWTQNAMSDIKDTQKNVQEYVIFLNVADNFPQFLGYPRLH